MAKGPGGGTSRNHADSAGEKAKGSNHAGSKGKEAKETKGPKGPSGPSNEGKGGPRKEGPAQKPDRPGKPDGPGPRGERPASPERHFNERNNSKETHGSSPSKEAGKPERKAGSGIKDAPRGRQTGDRGATRDQSRQSARPPEHGSVQQGSKAKNPSYRDSSSVPGRNSAGPRTSSNRPTVEFHKTTEGTIKDKNGRTIGSYSRQVDAKQVGGKTSISTKTTLTEYSEKGSVKQKTEVSLSMTKDRNGEVRGQAKVTITDGSGKTLYSSERSIRGGRNDSVSVQDGYSDRSYYGNQARGAAIAESNRTTDQFGLDADLGLDLPRSVELKMEISNSDPIKSKREIPSEKLQKSLPHKSANDQQRPEKQTKTQTPDRDVLFRPEKERGPRETPRNNTRDSGGNPDLMLLAPSSFNSENNLAISKAIKGLPAPLRYLVFYAMVKSGGPWDYKREFKNEGGFFYEARKNPSRLEDVPAEYRDIIGPGDVIINPYEDFGNYNYGYSGAASGFSAVELHAAAGAYQIHMKTSRPEWQNLKYLGDEPRDYEMIERGIRDFWEGRPMETIDQHFLRVPR